MTLSTCVYSYFKLSCGNTQFKNITVINRFQRVQKKSLFFAYLLILKRLFNGVINKNIHNRIYLKMLMQMLISYSLKFRNDYLYLCK
jgi:hypothetical protein